MKLYEVNQEIENLMLQLEPDPETGEIPMNTEELITRLEGLQMERSRILEYLAKLVLNCRAEAAAIKAEEKRLADRRHRLEQRDERILRILDRECAGVKTDCGVATVSYRATSHVDVTDCKKAINWFKRNGHKECFRTSDPEVNKTDAKKLLAAGIQIPGLTLVQDQSCSLK